MERKGGGENRRARTVEMERGVGKSFFFKKKKGGKRAAFINKVNPP